MAFCDPGASCPASRQYERRIALLVTAQTHRGHLLYAADGRASLRPARNRSPTAESAQRPQVRSSPIGLRVLAAMASSPLPRRYGPGVDRPRTRAGVIGARAQAPSPRTCPGYLAELNRAIREISSRIRERGLFGSCLRAKAGLQRRPHQRCQRCWAVSRALRQRKITRDDDLVHDDLHGQRGS
jgi:hypothetical protein